MSLRLLMTGDLHLGRSSSRLPDALKHEARAATAWGRIVDLALAEQVSAVLLSGDVADESNRFWEAVVHQSPLDSYALGADPEVPTLGFVHGDLGAASSRYAPLDMGRLLALAPQAWLLGHIHAPHLTKEAGAWVLMPGSPPALDPGEPGPHGPWIAEVSGHRALTAPGLPPGPGAVAGLHPGGFKAVEGRYELLGAAPSAEDVVDALQEELVVRRAPQMQGRVGFRSR